MPFARKDKEVAMGGAAAPAAQVKGSDLLIRFFESEWFDCFIALTYLHKSQSAGVQDYLSNRLYGLPEREVERYLSQLCQLCIQRPQGNSLERAVIDLCAQSLRIAVKTYWLLLAISQDLPKDARAAALRDACEQAALQGYWQLPFKQSRLPGPLGSPTKRPGGAAAGSRGGSSAALSPLVSPSGSFTQQRLWPGASPDPLARRAASSDAGQPLSPDGPAGDSSRPMSPDGLGGGLYSSVFMDTGVEGLIYGSPPPDLRAIRQHVPGSPRASQGALLEGPGHPLLPVRTAALPAALPAAAVSARRVSSLQQELGAGEGVSALLLRSSTAGEGGGPGVVQQSDDGTAAAAAQQQQQQLEQGQLFSPPNSPRRRQTTFGATLDFVETLCQASASLTAFQPEDRQWALRRALQQINVEIEKATRNGVAIWFPMGDADLRVVRLAPRESRLLNSREKAPFTLCVEVLDEAAAAAALEARAAAAAAAAAAREPAAAAPPPPLAASKAPSNGSGSYADSAQSLAAAQSIEEDAAVAAAAAEAAAAGIPFMANHHRTVSMDTAQSADTLSTFSEGSSMDAAALAAVQASSAKTGDAAGAAASLSPASASAGSSSPGCSGRSSSDAGGGLAGEPSFAGMLGGAAGEGAGGGSPARPRRLSDELEAVSEGPSCSGEGSGDGGGDALASQATPSSVRFDQQPPASPPQQGADERLQQQLAALRLGSPGKQAGGGTWIGGSPIRNSSAAAALGSAGAAASIKRRSGSGKGAAKQTSCDLGAALAGLRGEAPLVSVRFEVLNDRPPLSARSTGSAAADGGAPGTPDSCSTGSGSAGAGLAAAAASSAERRRASLDAAARAPPHVCDKSSWACKLGLCKLCNAKLATMGDEEAWLQPYVRVHFTVQGGVDLTIRKTPPKHQRVPSHEAILKVAKQHKLPPPVLEPPPQQRVEPPQPVVSAAAAAAQQQRQQQQQQQRRPQPQPQQQQAVVPGAAPRPCLPILRPASAGSPRPAVGGSEEEQAATAAQAAYGEAWQSRKERVQLASPHGRRPGWDLRCVIVKTGDDCRQELLAMQLIRAFHEIFGEAQLPLWLRPYEVLPTSNRTALIEMVPNAPSIHALKSKSPPGMSLREHLAAKCGGEGTPAFVRAQRCFVESLAAYSLVCYLLQIKDRHNGNILLDDEGHLIHIDFGFMLSNSPGGVNFESAPFKLTRELLEVMDSDSEGRASELFDYFKVLMIQGFLAARKHADRILLLAEIMQSSGCPCFKARVAAVQGLKKRFHLALPEPQVIEVVLGLISDSLDAWRTRQYDYYQRVLNGIL